MEVKQEYPDSLLENSIEIKDEFMCADNKVKVEEFIGDQTVIIKDEPEEKYYISESDISDLLKQSKDFEPEVKASDFFVNTVNLNLVKNKTDASVEPKIELLTESCDLPTLKSDCDDDFNQPCSSSQSDSTHKFSCTVCQKITACQCASSIDDHETDILDSALDNIYECKICENYFYTKSSLTRHSRIHTSQKLFRCVMCHKDFSKNLDVDIMVHTGLNSFLCEVCFKQFKQKESSSTHLKDQNCSKKYFKCNVCHKSFRWLSVLRVHMKVHPHVKPLLCEFCSEVFDDVSELKTHKNYCNGKPHLCEICSEPFSTKVHLQEHQKTHSDKNLLACEVCWASFNTKEDLDTHLDTHKTEQRWFECEICLLKFKSQNDLTIHSQFHSSPVQNEKVSLRDKTTSTRRATNNKCSICRIEFYRYDKYIRHIQTHSLQPHLEQLKCQICSIQFKKKEVFDKHVLVNKIDEGTTCTICNKPMLSKCHRIMHHKEENRPICYKQIHK